MSDDKIKKKEEAGSKPASSLEALLSTALVGLSGLETDSGRKGVYTICSPLLAFVIAYILREARDEFLTRRFKYEVNQDIEELRLELADATTTAKRRAAIQAELTELRKLRQRRYLKNFEIKSE